MTRSLFVMLIFLRVTGRAVPFSLYSGDGTTIRVPALVLISKLHFLHEPRPRLSRIIAIISLRASPALDPASSRPSRNDIPRTHYDRLAVILPCSITTFPELFSKDIDHLSSSRRRLPNEPNEPIRQPSGSGSLSFY